MKDGGSQIKAMAVRTKKVMQQKTERTGFDLGFFFRVKIKVKKTLA